MRASERLGIALLFTPLEISPMPLASIDEIRGQIGAEVGVSSWLAIDQARIDAFADATEDRQFIHIDPAAAAQTPFGGTIAHGFLSLSLLSRMGAEAMLLPDGLTMAVNYGLDRVRFLAPVRSGAASAAASRLTRSRRKRRANPDAAHRHGRDRRRGPACAECRLARPDFPLRREHARRRDRFDRPDAGIGRAYQGAFNATPGPTLGSYPLRRPSSVPGSTRARSTT